MNVVDLVIIGVVVVLGLLGLRSGLLKPVSGIGGLIIGIILAIQNSAEVATMLTDYIEGDLPSRVAAFGGIVLVTTLVARIAAWMVKKILKTLVLGWVDHVAGAVAGVALGLVLAGTVTYLLTGADLDPTRDALAASKLAPEISRATLVSSPQPWCSQIEGGNVEGADCTDVAGLFSEYFGESISQQVNGFLGEDIGTLADVLQTTLNRSAIDLGGILNTDAAALFSGDPDALMDNIGAVLDGKSREDIASLVSSAGAFQGMSTEEIESLISSMSGEDGLLEGKSPEEIATLFQSGELPQISQETIDALTGNSAATEEPQQTEPP